MGTAFPSIQRGGNFNQTTFNDSHTMQQGWEAASFTSPPIPTKSISRTTFQQRSFHQLCQYFLQKLQLTASKTLFQFLFQWIHSFQQQKELDKEKKIRESRQLASHRAKEKISDYMLAKQQRIEHLALINPLLVQKELQNDLMFRKFGTSFAMIAQKQQKEESDSTGGADNSTLESLLGLSASDVLKGKEKTSLPTNVTTTSATNPASDSIVMNASNNGTVASGLASGSFPKPSSMELALNPTNHHRNYSVSSHTNAILNKKPAVSKNSVFSSTDNTGGGGGNPENSPPPRKARLPTIFSKKASVQYNSHRHTSITSNPGAHDSSTDPSAIMSNLLQDTTTGSSAMTHPHHHLHGSISFIPNNQNMNNFKTEISSILGVFEDEIQSLKQELETQKLNYFYSRRLDLAYTPFEEEKPTDLNGTRHRSGATPIAATTLSPSSNQNVSILLNSLSNSVPNSARGTLLSAGGMRDRESSRPPSSAAGLQQENQQLKHELESMQKKLESFGQALQDTQHKTQEIEEKTILELQQKLQENTTQFIESATRKTTEQLSEHFQFLLKQKEDEIKALHEQVTLMSSGKKRDNESDEPAAAPYHLLQEKVQREYHEVMEKQQLLQQQITQLLSERDQLQRASEREEESAINQLSERRPSQQTSQVSDPDDEQSSKGLATKEKGFSGLGMSLFDYYHTSSFSQNLKKASDKPSNKPSDKESTDSIHLLGSSTQRPVKLPLLPRLPDSTDDDAASEEETSKHSPRSKKSHKNTTNPDEVPMIPTAPKTPPARKDPSFKSAPAPRRMKFTTGAPAQSRRVPQVEKKPAATGPFAWITSFFERKSPSPIPVETENEMSIARSVAHSRANSMNVSITELFDLHDSADEAEEKEKKVKEEAQRLEEAAKAEVERIDKNIRKLQLFFRRILFRNRMIDQSRLIYFRYRVYRRWLHPTPPSSSSQKQQQVIRERQQQREFLEKMMTFSQEILGFFVSKLMTYLQQQQQRPPLQAQHASFGSSKPFWSSLDAQLLEVPFQVFSMVERCMLQQEKKSSTALFPISLLLFQMLTENILYVLLPLQFFLQSADAFGSSGDEQQSVDVIATRLSTYWTTILHKYFHLMKMIYRVDVMKCMEPFAQTKQYLNFLLKGIHLFHTMGMRRCQKQLHAAAPDDGTSEMNVPFSLDLSSAAASSSSSSAAVLVGNSSPSEREESDPLPLELPPKFQEMFQHLLMNGLLYPSLAFDQIDMIHTRFVHLLQRIVEKHYEVANQPAPSTTNLNPIGRLLILPSGDGNKAIDPRVLASYRQAQEREKLFQSMFFLYFLDDLIVKYITFLEEFHQLQEERKVGSSSLSSPSKETRPDHHHNNNNNRDSRESPLFAERQLHHTMTLFLFLLQQATEEQKSYYFLLKIHEKYLFYLLQYYSKAWFLSSWSGKICQVIVSLNITFLRPRQQDGLLNAFPSFQSPSSSSGELQALVVKGYEVIQNHCLSGVFPNILIKLFITLLQRFHYDAEQQQQRQQQKQLPPLLNSGRSLREEREDGDSAFFSNSAKMFPPLQVDPEIINSNQVISGPSTAKSSSKRVKNSYLNEVSFVDENPSVTKNKKLSIFTVAVNENDINSGNASINLSQTLTPPSPSASANHGNTTIQSAPPPANYLLAYCKLLFSCYYQNNSNLYKLYANGYADLLIHVLESVFQSATSSLSSSQTSPIRSNNIHSPQQQQQQRQQQHFEDIYEFVYFLLVFCLNIIPTTSAAPINHLLPGIHQKIFNIVQKYSAHVFVSVSGERETAKTNKDHPNQSQGGTSRRTYRDCLKAVSQRILKNLHNPAGGQQSGQGGLYYHCSGNELQTIFLYGQHDHHHHGNHHHLE